MFVKVVTVLNGFALVTEFVGSDPKVGLTESICISCCLNRYVLHVI